MIINLLPVTSLSSEPPTQQTKTTWLSTRLFLHCLTSAEQISPLINANDNDKLSILAIFYIMNG